MTELEIQEIDENFKTQGSKIEGLLSMQFIKKSWNYCKAMIIQL